MHKFHVSLGVLFLLTFSLSSYSQEVKQTEVNSQKTPPDAPVAVSDLPENITIQSSFGNVVLPHDIHVKKVKLKCNVCHHQIKAKELDTPHPDYMTSSWISCQTCHAADSEFTRKYYKCSVCHHSEPNDIADETLSSKVVIHKSCWKCHETGTGVKASERCSQCHEKQEK